jgi:hypothetical protein
MTVAEISSVVGCGSLVFLFCEQFLEGRFHVRGSIFMVETTGCMPADVAILFSLFLIDTVK